MHDRSFKSNAFHVNQIVSNRKRRTDIAPQHFVFKQRQRIHSKPQAVDTGHKPTSRPLLNKSASVVGSNHSSAVFPVPLSRSFSNNLNTKRPNSSLYCGSLDQNEILEGYGMGMAVRRSQSITNLKRQLSQVVASWS
jgi:hypothetical protein